jgi:glycosyltransferase involved in cell wall biosynthesis
MSKIRVMHVIDTLHGGGAETSIVETIPMLASRDIETSIVTLFDDDGALDQRLSELGVTRIKLIRRGPRAQIPELRHLVRSQRPDVIHTSLVFSNFLGRIATWNMPTPVVTSWVSCDYGPEHRATSPYGSLGVRSAHLADLLTARSTDHFHAISEHVAQVMSRRLRVPGKRIHVVYRGRDSARLGTFTRDRRLTVRASLSIADDAPVVLSAARLDREKGVDTTFAAFRLLRERIPNAVLLVAGRPGNVSQDVEAIVQRTPGIRLLGHRTDIPDLMCAADVLAFPSRREGLGGTLLEAMALRLAIVASNVGAIPEAIGDVGWPLVPPGNAPALADGLASILLDNNANEGKRVAGERRFHTVFTADAAADGMAGLYRCAVDGGKRIRQPAGRSLCNRAGFR